MAKKAVVERKTRETEIILKLEIGGAGSCSISTGVAFFDHMLELFARFSGMDLQLTAKGDIDVDTHHLVEDTGICLGQALKKALGDKKGVKRFGTASTPMDEVLVNTSLDISGRPVLVFNVPFVQGREGSFEIEDTREFLKGFVAHSGITLHVNLAYGYNLHHVNEGIFKSLALALKEAVAIEDGNMKAVVPSTKGLID